MLSLSDYEVTCRVKKKDMVDENDDDYARSVNGLITVGAALLDTS